MADSTQIEWTDSTWNPVTGCSKITAGCDFCYAERFSERFRGVEGHPFQAGFDLTLRPARLRQPLLWRLPRRIFVNSMSDLFHKDVPTSFIDAVFDTMEQANWHTYQILTKRSSILVRYLKRRYGADPILGGPGWQARLDSTLSRGLAVEKLFRETLKDAGKFAYVVSTKIDKNTQDRPHFFLAYGTKDRAGLKAFRETEYKALREHARNRSVAMTRKRETKSGQIEFFADHEADMNAASIAELVYEQKLLAKEFLAKMLSADGPKRFSRVVDALLQAFMLRETNVKDLCSELAKEGKIRRTWGAGNRKPADDSMIGLTVG
jgi:hypothetical protein